MVGQSFSLPETRQLQYSEMPNAVNTFQTAFLTEDDKLHRYLRITPDIKRSVLYKQRSVLVNYLILGNAIRTGAAWTVDGGDGFLAFVEPASARSPRQRVADKFVLPVLGRIFGMLSQLNSKQQKERAAEYGAKLEAAIGSSIGDARGEMISVTVLGVAPAKQGHGYGTALVEALAAKADAEGRGIFLETNLYTDPFYAKFGFSTVAQITLGENNPTYKGPPVISCVMVRKPKKMEKRLY